VTSIDWKGQKWAYGFDGNGHYSYGYGEPQETKPVLMMGKDPTLAGHNGRKAEWDRRNTEAVALMQRVVAVKESRGKCNTECVPKAEEKEEEEAEEKEEELPEAPVETEVDDGALVVSLHDCVTFDPAKAVVELLPGEDDDEGEDDDDDDEDEVFEAYKGDGTLSNSWRINLKDGKYVLLESREECMYDSYKCDCDGDRRSEKWLEKRGEGFNTKTMKTHRFEYCFKVVDPADEADEAAASAALAVDHMLLKVTADFERDSWDTSQNDNSIDASYPAMLLLQRELAQSGLNVSIPSLVDSLFHIVDTRMKGQDFSDVGSTNGYGTGIYGEEKYDEELGEARTVFVSECWKATQKNRHGAPLTEASVDGPEKEYHGVKANGTRWRAIVSVESDIEISRFLEGAPSARTQQLGSSDTKEEAAAAYDRVVRREGSAYNPNIFADLPLNFDSQEEANRVVEQARKEQAARRLAAQAVPLPYLLRTMNGNIWQLALLKKSDLSKGLLGLEEDVLDASSTSQGGAAAKADASMGEGGSAANASLEPSKMKVTELRAELTRIGLETSGLKKVLVKRLQKAIAASAEEGGSMEIEPAATMAGSAADSAGSVANMRAELLLDYTVEAGKKQSQLGSSEDKPIDSPPAAPAAPAAAAPEPITDASMEDAEMVDSEAMTTSAANTLTHSDLWPHKSIESILASGTGAAAAVTAAAAADAAAPAEKKVLRDNIQSLTKQDLLRLMAGAGVEYISPLNFEEIKGLIKVNTAVGHTINNTPIAAYHAHHHPLMFSPRPLALPRLVALALSPSPILPRSFSCPSPCVQLHLENVLRATLQVAETARPAGAEKAAPTTVSAVHVLGAMTDPTTHTRCRTGATAALNSGRYGDLHTPQPALQGGRRSGLALASIGALQYLPSILLHGSIDGAAQVGAVPTKLLPHIRREIDCVRAVVPVLAALFGNTDGACSLVFLSVCLRKGVPVLTVFPSVLIVSSS
jgi:hypothetical protein